MKPGVRTLRMDCWIRAAVGVCLLLTSWCPVQADDAKSPAPSRESLFNRKQHAFADVLQATTGFKLLKVDTNLAAHRELLSRISMAAEQAGRFAASNGLVAARANEAGNALERFVRDALEQAGLAARVPRNSAGRSQSTGYPDVEITGATPCYLELKTYSAATARTTQRSFYYSPSETPKVTRDALHLLLGFELERTSHNGTSIFRPVRWKLISLEDLEVQLKLEFNQGNRGLYGERPALGEGALLAE